jgi:hypothetical protein
MVSTCLFFNGWGRLCYSVAGNRALRSATWPVIQWLPGPNSHPHLGCSLLQEMLAVVYPMDSALVAVQILPRYSLWVSSTSMQDWGGGSCSFLPVFSFPLLFPSPSPSFSSLVPVAFFWWVHFLALSLSLSLCCRGLHRSWVVLGACAVLIRFFG